MMPSVRTWDWPAAYGIVRFVRSSSIAESILAWTRMKRSASSSCGVLMPEYFKKVSPIFFCFALTLPLSPWSTVSFPVKETLSKENFGLLTLVPFRDNS